MSSKRTLLRNMLRLAASQLPCPLMPPDHLPRLFLRLLLRLRLLLLGRFACWIHLCCSQGAAFLTEV